MKMKPIAFHPSLSPSVLIISCVAEISHGFPVTGRFQRVRYWKEGWQLTSVKMKNNNLFEEAWAYFLGVSLRYLPNHLHIGKLSANC
jgi:hypothetical protein